MIMRPPYEVADILSDLWDKLENNPHYNTHQLRMLNAIRMCRSSELGWHIDECDNCSHLRISYNSCRNRHCPKCQGSNRDKWIRAQHEKLLPTKYFHVVFTIPAALNGLCLAYPKMMYPILFKASWETIKQFAKDKKLLGAQTGMTSILHSWGQNLCLHPHVHCIVPGGGITKTGKWKQARSDGKYLFCVKAMSPVFRAKFVHHLRKQAKQKGIAIPQSLYDKLFKNNWVIYAKQPFLGPTQIIEYLGRYTHKVAISNHRIIKVDSHKVFFKYKDYRKDGKVGIISLSKEEFIRRFSLHILPLRFVRIRHYGILSGRNSKRLPDIIKAIQDSGLAISNTYAKSSFGKNKPFSSLLCPCCKKGQMLTIAVFDGRGPPPASPKKMSPVPAHKVVF